MQPAAIYVDRIKVYAKDRIGIEIFFRDMKGTKGHTKHDMISN